jgi:universal stress protein E
MMRLLSATDLLPKSEFSIDRAGLLADELDAKLSLLHVVSPVASERVLEQCLKIAIGRMKSRVRSPLWQAATKPEVVVRPGNPARVLLDTISREKPDLLIMGPHERRGVVDALQGTIAEKVVSARNCPVLVVQQSANTSYRNVLFALDVTAGSRAAMRAAERLVLTDEAHATVIHACGSAQHAVLQAADMEAAGAGFHMECSPGAAHSAMRDLLEQESVDPRRYELVVTRGNPLPTIVRAIGKRQPDLLVMGTRGHGQMRRAVLGSVANQLLKVAPCDILMVPRAASTASAAEIRAIERWESEGGKTDGLTAAPVGRDISAAASLVPIQSRLQKHDGGNRRAHAHE